MIFTATTQPYPQRAAHSPGRSAGWALCALGGMACACLVVALSTQAAPTRAIVAVVLIPVGFFLLVRPYLAVMVMGASFYFDAYLSPGGQVLTLGKLVGVVALAAWLVEWGVTRRRVIVTPQLFCLLGLGGWLILSTVIAKDQHAAFLTDGRYYAFFLVFFLVSQAVDLRADRVQALTSVLVAASATSAAIGLGAFVLGYAYRASGPLSGANDFGFILSSTLPVAAWHIQASRTRTRQVLYTVATFILTITILGTLSRGALVGVGAMVGWAVWTGRVRLRRVAVALLLVAVLIIPILMSPPAFLQTDLARR